MPFMVADTRIVVKTKCGCKSQRLAAFECDVFEDHDLIVECGQFQERDDKSLICSSLGLSFWYEIPGGFRLEVHRPGEEKATGALEVDALWKRAELYGGGMWEDCLLEGPLGEVLFRNAMINRGGMQIHSAAIAYRGEGILFSAPSGTGKTTQARMWIEHLGASMIQGDRPIVRMREKDVLVYGTPWIGSDPLFQNICLPVKAIVFLEQAPVNEILNLDPNLAVQYLLPRCFLPYFSQQMMNKALLIAESILRRVPCYLLRCMPEMAAAEFLHDMIYSQDPKTK